MSDYAVSQFWQYVKPGDLRTCDECTVTQRRAALERVLLHGKQIDRCKDKGTCARWKSDLAKGRAK
jgi:hypothetical protein